LGGHPFLPLLSVCPRITSRLGQAGTPLICVPPICPVADGVQFRVLIDAITLRPGNFDSFPFRCFTTRLAFSSIGTVFSLHFRDLDFFCPARCTTKFRSPSFIFPASPHPFSERLKTDADPTSVSLVIAALLLDSELPVPPAWFILEQPAEDRLSVLNT